MNTFHPAAGQGGEMGNNSAREGHYFTPIGDAAQRAIARLLVNRFGLSGRYAAAAAPHLLGRVDQ